MRKFICIIVSLWLFGICLSHSIAAEDWNGQSQLAQIVVEEAACYSGPTKQDYVTDYLTRGTQVEVHRKSRGGWLAIHPPRTSFCWIESQSLIATSQSDVYRVNQDGVICWIGSSFSTPEQFRWQVQLKQGAQLAVLENARTSRAPLADAPSWYKIEPPTGEFRWIRAESIGLQLAESASRPEKRLTPGVAQVSWESAKDSDPGARSISESSPQHTIRNSHTPSPPSEPRWRHPTEANSNNDAYTEIVGKFAEMVAQPIQHWQLKPLREAAIRLSRSEAQPLKNQAAQLVKKIDRFQDLQDRNRLIDTAIAPASYTEELSPSRSSSGLGSRFDGEGYLMPVHSRTATAPPFALVDEEGQIVCFLRPAPGLRVHRYLNQKIGVFGPKRLLAANHPPLLTAERVVTNR